MAAVRHLDAFAMVTVIELPPSSFSERPYPEGTTVGKEAREAWWRASLADGGVTGLDPIAPGSWHVAVRQLIDVQTLERVLEAHFRSYSDPDEPIGMPLSGGVALLTGGQVLLEPGCCSDLGDLANWEAVATEVWDGSRDLWTGHPHPLAQLLGARLLLTDATDDPAEPRYSLDRPGLVAALVVAQEERVAFGERLLPIVRRRFSVSDELARPMTTRLVGIS
jgi:hypothetical protein